MVRVNHFTLSHGPVTCRRSERELDRQLNPPRSAAAQERIAYADVAGGGDLVCADAHFPVTVRLKTAAAGRTEIRGRISDKCRKQRTGKVRMVQDIEEFRAELQVQPLGNRRVLVDCQVPLLVGGAG